MGFIFFVILMCSLFCGCSTGLKNQVYNNLSEIADFVMVGQNENMSVSLMCGRREVDYKINGISTELIPYGILTLNFNMDNEEIGEIGYVLYVGTVKFQGEMLKHPYENSWVADIKSAVNKEENISVDVIIGEEKCSLKLKPIDSNWTTSSNNVVEILIREYKDNLKRMIVEGDLKGEVYIKLINESSNLSHYYYYVSVVDRKGGSFNFLLSPITKEILASNSSVG